MTSEAQDSSILKNKQKSFKPGLFEAKNYIIMITKKCLELGVVMLLYIPIDNPLVTDMQPSNIHLSHLSPRISLDFTLLLNSNTDILGSILTLFYETMQKNV